MADYVDMTVAELKGEARRRGITGYPRMTREKIIKALQDFDSADPANFADLPAEIRPAPEAEPEPELPPEATDPEPEIPVSTEEAKPAPEPHPILVLQNDITYLQNGVPIRLKAGREMTAAGYDLEKIKASNGVLVPKAVFEAGKKG